MRMNLLTILFILMFFLRIFTFAENFSYKVTTDKKVEYEKYIVLSNDQGYLVETDWKGFKFITYVDFSCSTKKWKSVNEEKQVNVTFKRLENVLEGTGFYKGKPYERKFTIDKNPWFQNWNLGLGNFVVSAESSINFWSIEPRDLMLTKFKAIKGKLTNIMLNGKELEALYVKVTLDGFAGAFWHADYWCRPSDGRILVNKMAQGMGAPKTVTELYEENP